MYIIIWQYKVKAEFEQAFELAYGSQGEWVMLFSHLGNQGYIKTQLLKQERFLYLTIDSWDSKENYERFLQKAKKEYEHLDKKFENFTEYETKIGNFLEIQAKCSP